MVLLNRTFHAEERHGGNHKLKRKLSVVRALLNGRLSERAAVVRPLSVNKLSTLNRNGHGGHTARSRLAISNERRHERCRVVYLHDHLGDERATGNVSQFCELVTTRSGENAATDCHSLPHHF